MLPQHKLSELNKINFNLGVATQLGETIEDAADTELLKHAGSALHESMAFGENKTMVYKEKKSEN